MGEKVYIYKNYRRIGLDAANLRLAQHPLKSAIVVIAESTSSASQQLSLENMPLEEAMKASSEKYSNALTAPSEELASIYPTSQLRSLHVVVRSHLLRSSLAMFHMTNLGL